MATLRVIAEGETLPLKVPDEMMRATDAQILSYVSEVLNREITEEDWTVERTPSAILVHPKARYG